MTRTSAYGSWDSPLSASSVGAGALRIADLQADGDDVYWVETRPAEGGRCAVVRWRHREISDVLPPPWSARTSVHEYGGGALRVHQGTIFFSNADDGALLRLDPGAAEPRTVCEQPLLRYADFVVDAARGRLLSVLEDHADPGRVRNLVASIPVDGGRPRPLAYGADFYAAPRLSPDGRRLAWLSWNHPALPWDSSQLHVAEIAGDGSLGTARVVAGGESESVLSPAWAPDGRLHYISDRSGWWNLYVDDGAAGDAVLAINADCSGPPWVFGLQPYAFLADGGIAITLANQGRDRIDVVDAGGAVTTLPQPLTDIGDAMISSGNGLIVVGGGPHLPQSVVAINRDGAIRMLRQGADVALDDNLIAVAEPMTFPSDSVTAHAILYRPRNPLGSAPPGTRPPLIVRAHGGPTSAARTSLDPVVQFWTTRGFMFCDVDYRGSTGYGREFRRSLYGQNGVVDVADCRNVASHLADRGEVDASAMFIRGGSAGGHIALLAVCGENVFAASSSHFGVADPLILAADTHKFEQRYYDALIGPLPAAEDAYVERSPLRRAATISVPVALFQGLEDRVVPPAQAESMRAALVARGVPVVSANFAGEGHGFRRADTIATVLEAELWLFRRLLGHDVGAPPPGVQTSGL